MTFRDYEDLPVWQKAMDLVVELYKVSGTWPEDEKLGLTYQLRQAAISVPSKIAGGVGRQNPREFWQCLDQARSALFEIETMLFVAERLGYSAKRDAEALVAKIKRARKLLVELMDSLGVSEN